MKGSLLSAQAKRYTPFGNGIRNCVGMQLSKMNIPTAVAMIVSQFKLALSPEVSPHMASGRWPAPHPCPAAGHSWVIGWWGSLPPLRCLL